MDKKTKEKLQDPKIQKINSSKLMWKFRFYGFFKNLRFFEPFLLIMLLDPSIGLSLFEIGLLISIREIFTYTFEIPSGVIADKFGKKRELLICFVFYIISFVFYFFGLDPDIAVSNLIFLVSASIFFGLGESFRSGTHKAMELLWMENEDLMDYKTHVYGSTRAYSLLGSALSAILAVFLKIFIPANKWIFLITIIPYILDFILIASYPSYMNDHQPITGGYWNQLKIGFKGVGPTLKSKKIRKAIFSSAIYDAIYKTLKDYIQPIMVIFISIFLIQIGKDETDTETANIYISIILGGIYCIFYLISSLSSQNAFKLKKLFHHAKTSMDILFDLFALILLLEALFMWIEIPMVIIFLYLLIYVFENFRRPLAVDYMGEVIPKEERATILSIESQIKSISVLIFAPLFGFIADFSIPLLFLILAICMVIINHVFLTGRPRLEEK
ncbi:MFS transporter [Promethearchaeum syntrophicum]|uniref:MFS transporter n=1 Tax=Promethearchaeum syntrophicum TaxID=2594042 RepID=A0A5B9DF52_9ARCH